ncbi:hypothetical protein QBC41DRAFT_379707 [Cercophora samala]|uniref:F-box domain-containing protein n=1 Tax=Cercophora samala TaxID=330535 RepID=A0AA39Z793_9PEZI|nr:hypothetical protein QBC41DRAFT_379707 [Cercophora samala]
MLDRLPVELLHDITARLLLEDLKSLSCASKIFHSVCAPKLWKTIRIDIPRVKRKRCVLDIDRVAQCASALGSATPALSNARRLTFNRDLRWLSWQALHVDTKPEEETGEESNSEEPEELPDIPCFHLQPRVETDSTGQEKGSNQLPADDLYRLARMAESVIEVIPDGQLDGFSWDVATCIPGSVLETLYAKQPGLRSLRLTTDGECVGPHGQISIPFRQLTHVSWSQPNSVLLGSLGDCLEKNRDHLTELDITLEPSYFSEDDMDSESDWHVDGGSPMMPFSWFLPKIRPLFPTLTVLSLNNVSLGGGMRDVFDIRTLKVLAIRQCHLWERVLKRIVTTRTPVCLDRFEIQPHEEDECEGQELLEFLLSFQGLKELFIGFSQTVLPCSLPLPFLAGSDPPTMMPLWHAISHHHATLKRLVVHQRGARPGPGYRSRNADFVHDGCHFDIPQSEREMWKISPSSHPLSRLDLEPLPVVNCPRSNVISSSMQKEVLVPFTLKSTLKMVHFRQTGSQIKARGSRALEYPQTDPGARSRFKVQSRFRHDHYLVAVAPEELEKMLLPSFAALLDWIFGPTGISSLEVVAFGDYAHGRNGWALHNMFVSRGQPGKRYRVFDARDKTNRHEWIDTAHKYKSFLESCPVGPMVESLTDRRHRWYNF